MPWSASAQSPGLGGVVVGIVGIAHDAIGGSGIQDHSAVVFHHVAGRGLRDIENAGQVHGKHPAPLLGRDVEKLVTNADAGIVDDDIHSAQIAHNGGEGMLDFLLIGRHRPQRSPAIPGSCARILSHAAGSRSRTATAEPSSRNRAAVAAPMPLAPPVITTRLPLSPRIVLLELARPISARQDNKRSSRCSPAPVMSEYLLHSCAPAMAAHAEGRRTQLYADPEGRFVHDVILDSCRRHAAKIAMVDTSCMPARRITYAAYGELVERAARGLVAAGIRPGEMIGIYLPNCWEFGVAYHAATLAGAVPTTMNPTYREREVRYQLENSDAVALITDGALLTGIDLSGLPALRNVYTVRKPGPGGSQPLDSLFEPKSACACLSPQRDSRRRPGHASLLQRNHRFAQRRHAVALQPGGQCLSRPSPRGVRRHQRSGCMLCFLPLYHIYWLDCGFEPHSDARAARWF